MTPTTIKNSNFTFGAPDEMPDCLPLRVRRGSLDGHPIIQSAWEPTPEERQRIEAGLPVILTVYAKGLPPMALSVEYADCDMCSEPVKEGEGTIQGARHLTCNAIALAALSPEESQALTDQIAQEVGECLISQPDKYVELRPGVFLPRENVASHCAKPEAVITAHRRVVTALSFMLAKAGVSEEDVKRVAEQAYNEGTLTIEPVKVEPPPCPLCNTKHGPGRNNTEEDPCPNCGCTF